MTDAEPSKRSLAPLNPFRWDTRRKLAGLLFTSLGALAGIFFAWLESPFRAFSSQTLWVDSTAVFFTWLSRWHLYWPWLACGGLAAAIGFYAVELSRANEWPNAGDRRPRSWPTFGATFETVQAWYGRRRKARVAAYYPLIDEAASQVPITDREARQRVYATARMVLAECSAPSEFERERRALETAIHKVERSRRITIGNPLHRPTTVALVIALLFPRVWLIDVTCMSLYWVARIRHVSAKFQG